MFLTYKTANKPVGICLLLRLPLPRLYRARFLAPICQQAWAMSLAGAGWYRVSIFPAARLRSDHP